MRELEVIDDPAAAVVALDPVRARLLAALAQPGSASTLATRTGLTRQRVNYHLRSLEAHGLVRQVSQRHWGGLTERILVASAASYVVSPAALGEAAGDPARAPDRLSARYLIALAARVVREVAELVRRADRQRRRLATLALDAEVRFRSPAERAAFTDDLAAAVAALAARYHDPAAADGRAYRLVVAAYPRPSPPDPDAPA
jgi:DNA-binding transcriptional ArsR family regulator